MIRNVFYKSSNFYHYTSSNFIISTLDKFGKVDLLNA